MDSKDTSAVVRHSTDLALLRIGNELRRRVRDREPLLDALRDTAERMQADAALLWMPFCKLELQIGRCTEPVTEGISAEFTQTMARIAAMKSKTGHPLVIQGDDVRPDRQANCRLILVPIDLGATRFPAWVVYARELSSERFDTWAAVLAQVQSLRLARRLMREFDPATGHLSVRGLETVTRQRPNAFGALVKLDLDGLRPLNHTRGTAVGDDVILAFSKVLAQQALPPGAMIARGFDASFFVLLPEKDAQAATQFAMQVQNDLERVQIKDQEDFPRLTVSCGVTEYNFAAESLTQSGQQADLVLRLAKERGRSRVEVHQSNDASVIRRQTDDFAADDLRQALRTGTLELFAQPIVSLRGDDKSPGFELLLRQRDEDGDFADMGRMLAVAQRYQLFPMVDRYVVDHAFTALAPHREMLAQLRLSVSINVSGQSICNPEFTEHFIQRLQRAKLPLGCIIVEVTEQVAAGNLVKAGEAMRRLRTAGCGIAIDDFGTGANSLAYVHQLPVTRLKIDGGFIRDIITNKRSEAAVRGIVQLAKDFVLQTVGEYVETPEQADLLRRLGVDFGQGYLFGKPEPLEQALAARLAGAAASAAA
jgi:diguanylate cyclase (GGDEF)-like protein